METELPVGRELDALVAGRVLGWKRETSTLDPRYTWHRDSTWEFESRYYSADLNTAWEIVEHLEAHPLEWHCSLFRLHDDDDVLQWYAEFTKQRADYWPAGATVVMCAETPAHALCLAALKLFGVT